MEEKTLLGYIAPAQEMISKLIASEGEISPELEALQLKVGADIAHKLESYVYLMGQIPAQVEFLKSKAKQFQAAAKALENAEDQMKERLKIFATETGQTELVGVDHVIKISEMKSAVEVIDEDLIPDIYKSEVITKKVEKKKIEADLAMGEKIPGAVLRIVKRVTISPNKKGL